MAEVKGKFILLIGNLMLVYKEKRAEFDARLFSETGRHWNELDPEGWYDAKLYREAMQAYTEGSITGARALVTLGKHIYPTIKSTVGFPPGLETPLDYILFEAEGYMNNLRGPEIEPRKFVKKELGHVIVEMNMKEQDCRVMEGVYAGIMGMVGVSNGKVEHALCIKKGDDCCRFQITW
jgi:hypothetical protein